MYSSLPGAPRPPPRLGAYARLVPLLFILSVGARSHTSFSKCLAPAPVFYIMNSRVEAQTKPGFERRDDFTRARSRARSPPSPARRSPAPRLQRRGIDGRGRGGEEFAGVRFWIGGAAAAEGSFRRCGVGRDGFRVVDGDSASRLSEMSCVEESIL